ncbi:MAG: hypothetical protein K2G63_07610 [Oscillospiraceae bacterium]|nr:hypothetical protein [Oscillospiraceae bacterium]
MSNKLKAVDLLMLTVFFLSYIKLSAWAIFDLFFLGFYYKPKNQNDTMKAYFSGMISALLIVFLLWLCRFFPTYNLYREDGVLRYTFGFSHPNGLGRFCFLCCSIFVLMKRININWKEITVIAIVAVFIYVFPNSGTSSIVIFLLAFACSVVKTLRLAKNHCLIEKKCVRIMGLSALPIMIVVQYVLMKKYIAGNSFVMNLPQTIISRLVLGIRGLKIYGINLFGNNIEFTSTVSSYFSTGNDHYFVLDSLFFFLPIRMGLIVTIFFVAAFFCFLIKFIREYDYFKIVIALLFLVYSLTENGIMGNSAFLFSFLFITPSKPKQNITTLLNRYPQLASIIWKFRRKDGKNKYKKEFHVSDDI